MWAVREERARRRPKVKKMSEDALIYMVHEEIEKLTASISQPFGEDKQSASHLSRLNFYAERCIRRHGLDEAKVNVKQYDFVTMANRTLLEKAQQQSDFMDKVDAVIAKLLAPYQTTIRAR